MHGLTLATVPPGATTRPLAERPAGSRTIEALAPAAARTPVVDDLLERLTHAARAYVVTPSSPAGRRRGQGRNGSQYGKKGASKSFSGLTHPGGESYPQEWYPPRPKHRS